jgi:carbamoyl-phosphate synthase small subunit
MKAVLVLEDGRVFPGEGFGAEGAATGEIVFNTSMTGYQEILTDPSYHRQIVAMTVPHVGNTGVNLEDPESGKVWVAGFVVRSLSPIASSWRNRGDLGSYLRDNGIIGVSAVATRALVRHIRALGVMRAVVAQGAEAEDIDRLVDLARSSPDMAGANLVDDVTAQAPYDWREESDSQWYGDQREAGEGPLVVAYDYGIKRNILRMMTDRGLRVRVVPAWTPPTEVLRMEPAGVFLSNGPGDPAAVDYAIANVKSLLGAVPIFGICLGHQILALALGGETKKMRFGHRGGNQPVKHLASGEVEIASHNHGFAVSAGSNLNGGEITHLNLNDNTVAGLRHRELRAFSVQYHPEASPGPHDSFYLFDEFVDAARGEGS